MPKALTDEQVANYHRDGYIAPVRALDDAETADFRKKFEAYEAAHEGWYEMSKGQKLYLLQTWARDLGQHPKILDAVEDVMGPNLMVWGLSLFVKDANSPSYVSWHQDSTYWGLSKPDVVTAWIALSPANKQSGCMKMMPGTHKWEQVEHKDTLAQENLLTRGQEIAVDVDDKDAEYLELEPGEISLHNIRTVHASAPKSIRSSPDRHCHSLHRAARETDQRRRRQRLAGARRRHPTATSSWKLRPQPTWTPPRWPNTTASWHCARAFCTKALRVNRRIRWFNLLNRQFVVPDLIRDLFSPRHSFFVMNKIPALWPG